MLLDNARYRVSLETEMIIKFLRVSLKLRFYEQQWWIFYSNDINNKIVAYVRKLALPLKLETKLRDFARYRLRKV